MVNFSKMFLHLNYPLSSLDDITFGIPVGIIMSVATSFTLEPEGDKYFPPQFTEIKGNRKIDEIKEPEWMDAQIKNKEVNISAND